MDIEIAMMGIGDLSKAWRCSRNFLWERCKNGDIPATKIGARWFIPKWWVDQQMKWSWRAYRGTTPLHNGKKQRMSVNR